MASLRMISSSAWTSRAASASAPSQHLNQLHPVAWGDVAAMLIKFIMLTSTPLFRIFAQQTYCLSFRRPVRIHILVFPQGHSQCTSLLYQFITITVMFIMFFCAAPPSSCKS